MAARALPILLLGLLLGLLSGLATAQQQAPAAVPARVATPAPQTTTATTTAPTTPPTNNNNKNTTAANNNAKAPAPAPKTAPTTPTATITTTTAAKPLAPSVPFGAGGYLLARPLLAATAKPGSEFEAQQRRDIEFARLSFDPASGTVKAGEASAVRKATPKTTVG